MVRVSLTEQVHRAVVRHIHSDTVAIDATAGNGFDTLFLAENVGESGHVYAFDVQQQAIDSTKLRLAAAGLLKQVTLICAGHETMLERIPEADHGKVDIIVFNLGYLPRADKSVITRESTTITALNSALQLLSKNGYISILAYPGHAGGREETEAAKAWANRLSRNSYQVCIHQPGNSGTSPEWIEISSIP
ncbi:Putative rRNA methylase [Mariprofundus ferrinatatus]|uniref:rRNA methylase n=1 Tax=Mariprofundus ferrinatatus TaxID=1921087 RepID=A0A2K8L2R5_9PROT|nr:class I SAM-dependent methyltransferase [Mariprofundus ferrinatatus]ATX81543.1 Putative rRNA methylase [Mariprofundus ferrinatatus]